MNKEGIIAEAKGLVDAHNFVVKNGGYKKTEEDQSCKAYHELISKLLSIIEGKDNVN